MSAAGFGDEAAYLGFGAGARVGDLGTGAGARVAVAEPRPGEGTLPATQLRAAYFSRMCASMSLSDVEGRGRFEAKAVAR